MWKRGQSPFPHCSERDGAEAHAAGGGQSRDEGRECGHNHLGHQFHYPLLVHKLIVNG